MKKLFVPIIFLVFLSIMVFVIFIEARNNVSKDEALLIGEEKYLKFLWMVDGAFNNERFKEEFTVNGKKLPDEEKIFTCKYKNKKDSECIGNNFEEEFKKLFSKDITYDRVYSDGTIFSWISIKNGKFCFNNINTCNVNRMSLNHTIKVMNISKDKITYEVIFKENQRANKRDFILVFEDNEWKISTAFYHDLCGMKYFIY